MIGLMFMAGIAVWLALVVYLCKRIPRWLGMTRFVKVTQYLLFPVLLLLPIADELIGRWQFNRLCEREAVVNLSPDWRNVKRAKRLEALFGQLSGYATRIEYMESKYQDVDTGKVFLYYKSFYNYGGFLMDKVGFRLSGAPSSCRPSNYDQVRGQIKIQQLLD